MSVKVLLDKRQKITARGLLFLPEEQLRNTQSGQVRKTLCLCIALVLTAFCFLSTGTTGVKAQHIRKILVLNSYHPTRHWTKMTMKGIESALEQYEGIIKLDVEYMGTGNFTDEKHYENLYALYKNKASHGQYDAIIVSDDNALSFLLKHRTELYPNVPVVFCGINGFRESMLQNHNSITGITEERTFEPTIETALKLHPSAKRVVILFDKRSLVENSLRWSERIEELKHKLGRPIEFSSSFLQEPDKHHLVRAIKGLGDESIIIFAGKLAGPGEIQVFKGVKSTIFKCCIAPIYALSAQWFDYVPIVGGKFSYGFYQGQTAAQIVVRILNGESAEKIPIMRGTSDRYMFDYAQLKRFDIPFSKLPEGSVIINEPKSFYYLYKKQIWAVLAVIAVLTAVVIILSANVLNRKRAEKKLLNYQAKLRSLASELSLTEERERRRIATELHDRISQHLVISKVKLQTLREPASSGSLVKELDEVCNLLDQTIQNTRSLTFDLSSPILYELGFEVAVADWLTEQVEQKHGIKSRFEDDGQSKPLDDDIRALLFRNVQELLINVVKHAHAHKVRIYSQKVNSRIQISIEDDGVGFNVSGVVSRPTREGGFGLFSIRERLEQLGGELVVESEPGHGTRITVTAPLKQEKINIEEQK